MASKKAQARLAPRLISIAVASCFATSAAIAAPPVLPTTAGVPNVGIQSITQIDRTLNVLANSQRSIAHWNSFSIGADAAVRIQQPSAGSAHLSRVVGQDPSAILGSLWSNGRVFLVNPNGILFGAGAQIDVGGLVATSLNLSNSDFLAGRLNFTGGQGAGSVVNQGNITTGAGGNVYLVGPAVTNSGIITTPQGEVVLAAGNSVELVNPGTPNLSVEISAPDNEARNLGQIIADAGRIGIYAGLITNSGTIRADSAASEGGRILLKATKGVTLEDSSVLSAQGQGGGEIKVLADDFVRVAGRLDASAPNGGDGGFIETSASKVKVESSAFITTEAPNGKTGNWLIDPADFYIADPAYGGDISGAQLGTNLGSTSVTIYSDQGAAGYGGGIYVNEPVSWSSANSLTLVARSDVNVNQSLANSGSGGIYLYAGWDGVVQSVPAIPNYGVINIGAPMTTSGDVYLVAGGYITQTAAGVITANGLLADATYGVSLNGATNMVNTLAGRATGSNFYFTNGQPLIVGTVGGVSGITAGPAGCCDANVGIVVTQGNLTVNQDIRATGGFSGEGSANISLSTQNGSILVQNGAIVSARGADAQYGDGGYGYVSMNAQGGSITVSGSSGIEATGGNASSSGYGGQGNVYLNASGSITVSDASVTAKGGAGQGGYSYYGYDGGEGYIYVNAGGNIVVNSGSTLEAVGGDGANGGYGNVYLYAGTGISVDNSLIRAQGGGGLGYTNFGSGCSAGCPTGGNGGDTYISLYNNGGSTGISITNSTIEAIGGPAGGPAASSYGGYADINIDDYNSAGVNIAGSTITATGGPGGANGFGETGYISIYSGITASSDINVSNSTIRADGAEGSIYFSANNISVLNSTVTAIGDGTGYYNYGSWVELYAGGMIDTSGSTLSAAHSVAGGFVELDAFGNITLGNLVTDTLGSVYVYSSSGSIIDGNSGLNLQTPYAYLQAATGIGTVANPLETLVGQIYLYNPTSGEIGVINSDNLILNLYQGGTGTAAVGATGTMLVGSAYSGGNLSLIANGLTVYGGAVAGATMVLNSQSGTLDITLDGGEGFTANNINLLGANINIGSASGIYPKFASATNVLSVSTPGNFKIMGGSGLNSSTTVMGGAGVSVTAGGNVIVEGGTDPGAYARLIGSPDVFITAGGTVSVNPGNAFATIESGLPATIYLNFPNNTVGDGTLDYSVAGVTSAIVDGNGTSGFFAGGLPAILDVNLIVTPRGGVPAVPPSPIPEAILELPPPAPTQIHDPIVGESGQTTGASQTSDVADQTGGGTQTTDGKDEKKKITVCS